MYFLLTFYWLPALIHNIALKMDLFWFRFHSFIVSSALDRILTLLHYLAYIVQVRAMLSSYSSQHSHLPLPLCFLCMDPLDI